MDLDYAVEVENVTIKFDLQKKKVDNFKEYMIARLKGGYTTDEFTALKNISCRIPKGDSFAILGDNGSGKSTLLKIISGVYVPTSGNVQVNGVMAPMIELGAGFDMELSGRENIFLNGAVLGYPRKFMENYFDEIMDFAELWDFVDVPVKNYSSGMKARLGFSIATLIKPDILICDEVLSVGDAAFRKKCEDRMSQVLSDGTTLIFVSHSIEQVKRLCRHGMWINKGEMMCVGEIEEVAAMYEEHTRKKIGQ